MNTKRNYPYIKGETTLLFVDMQEIWIRPSFSENPEKEKDYYYNRLEKTVIPNQKLLLSAFRNSGENVLHTIIQSLTEDGRDRSLDHKISGISLSKSDDKANVIKELEPVENEIVLPKTSSGVFNSTSIDYVLRNLGTKQLVVCGVVTDQCVDMAVRDAADRGYIVTLVEDACATQTEERQQACINAISGYCHIADTESVLEKILKTNSQEE